MVAVAALNAAIVGVLSSNITVKTGFACGNNAHKYKFIGSQVERSESPGCILWNQKFVEFNDHRLQRRGCNVGRKGGECLCTSAP